MKAIAFASGKNIKRRKSKTWTRNYTETVTRVPEHQLCGQHQARLQHTPGCALWWTWHNHSAYPGASQNFYIFLSKINKAPKFPIPNSFSWSFKMNSVSRLPFLVSEGRKTDTQENFPINQSWFHFKASKLSQAFQRSPFLSEILHLFNKAGRIYYLGTGKHFSFSTR